MVRVTSKDVARHAGVSVATVSHVINETRYVSDETRQKVQEAITALGYRPNAVARSLVTRTTHNIGVLIAEITNPFFTVATRGIEDEALSQKYNIVLCNTDENPIREEESLHLLATQRIDGLIVAPTGVESQSLRALADAEVPIVQLDRVSPGLDAPLVGINNEESAHHAVSHLIGLGHRRIACVIDYDAISTQRQRREGWERALWEAGLPVDCDLVIQADPRFYGVLPDSSGSFQLVQPANPSQRLPSAYEALLKLLRASPRPSAVFVATNQLTLGTLYAFRTCGLRCPEDISMVSVDDHDWAPLFTPPLTVVRQPAYELGRTAARLLKQMIDGEEVETPPLLKADLVVRSSCGPPPGDLS